MNLDNIIDYGAPLVVILTMLRCYQVIRKEYQLRKDYENLRDYLTRLRRGGL